MRGDLGRSLLLRIAWPALAAGLLFLTSCMAAAVYLGLRQEATVRALEDSLQARRIVDDLLRDLGELIEIGPRVDGPKRERVEVLRLDVRRLLRESDAAADAPDAGPVVDRLEEGFRRYQEAAESGGESQWVDALAILENDVRRTVRELDARVGDETERALAAMHRTASWTAWALAGVGIVATIFGLVSGYTTAVGLERAMIRAGELSALGQMAAGMAHELRNPLTAVSMLVQLHREKAEEQGLPAEDLAVMEREIARMEDRLNAFIDFARPARPRWRRIDLVQVAANTLALVQGRAAKQGVQLTLVRPASPMTVEADGEQVGRVMLNLAMNALDAMPRGGRLTATLTRAPDGFVEAAFDDTGPGVADDALPRLFEPFFTSKEAGLGLGLPISQRIARDHGGRLVASNRQGDDGGARFVLRLPGPSMIAPASADD